MDQSVFTVYFQIYGLSAVVIICNTSNSESHVMNDSQCLFFSFTYSYPKRCRWKYLWTREV